MHAIHPRRRPCAAAMLAALFLSVLFSACDDEPEECKRVPQGEFTFRVDPERAADPYTVQATVQSIEYIPGIPPVYVYQLRTTQPATISITVEDLGVSLPVEEGQTYTFDIQSVGGVPSANGIRISDGQGVRFLAATDWRPNYSVFTGGYGALGAAGALQVFFGDAGCEPRVDNSDCYLEIRNHQLEFVLGGSQRTKLWNAQERTLAGWRIHVFKANLVKVKVGCTEGLQQQVSFSVERDGIRAS